MPSSEDIKKLYTLTLEVRSGYLYAYVEGERDNYEITRSYWREVATEAMRTGVSCVLVEENIVEKGSLIDAYQGASNLLNLFAAGTKIAFVDRFIAQNDVNQFAELVAVNRGANGRVFNSVAEAEKWLLAT